MAASTLTIRLDSELKEETARVVERYGFDLSTVIRVFFTQIVNTQSIPLSLDYGRRGAPNPAVTEAPQVAAAASAAPVAQAAPVAEVAQVMPTPQAMPVSTPAVPAVHQPVPVATPIAEQPVVTAAEMPVEMPVAMPIAEPPVVAAAEMPVAMPITAMPVSEVPVAVKVEEPPVAVEAPVAHIIAEPAAPIAEKPAVVPADELAAVVEEFVEEPADDAEFGLSADEEPVSDDSGDDEAFMRFFARTDSADQGVSANESFWNSRFSSTRGIDRTSNPRGTDRPRGGRGAHAR